MITETLILTLILIYFTFYIIYIRLLIKLFDSHFENDMPDNINFSVIVAAKNESKNIVSLINTFKPITYPQDMFELIIVDDNSSDGTFEIAKDLIEDYDNFNVLKATNEIYEGKRGALETGITQAKFENILITDADCVPSANWIKEMAKKFNGHCDFVFGIAPFKQEKSFVNKISCYENFRNTLLSFFTAKIGIPHTAAARNFGFKLKSFEKLGGYKNTTDTISGDDDLLLREAVKHKMKICTLTSKDGIVLSESEKTFKQYFRQRARHTQTSLHYRTAQKLFLSAWHIINIFFLFSVLLIPFNEFFVLPFVVKLFFDITLAWMFQKKFNYKFSLPEIFYLQIIYELFLMIHFFNAKFGKITWK